MWVVAAVSIALNPGQPAVFATLLLLGLLFLLWALVRSDPVGPVPTGLYRHVLKEDLQMTELGEIGGVQFTALPFPDRVAIGDPMVLLVLVQNVYTEPRVFRLSLRSGVMDAAAAPNDVDLAGGECGVVIVSLIAKAGTTPGEYSLRFRPRAKALTGAGVRIFSPPKRSAFVAVPQLQAIHTLTEGARSGSRPGLPPSGYRVVFRPGMQAPDIKALEFLNSTAR
jgi:hypothetical protein